MRPSRREHPLGRGNIYVNGADFDFMGFREGGEILDRIELDRGSFACMLGGPDGRTLFVTAAEWNPANPFGGPRTGRVLATRATAPAVGWP